MIIQGTAYHIKLTHALTSAAFAVALITTTPVGCTRKTPASPMQEKATPTNTGVSGGINLRERAHIIMIPDLALKNLGLQEPIKLLSEAAIKNDPEGRGANFIMAKGVSFGIPQGQITLIMKNVSLANAIERLCQAGRVRVRVEPYGFVIEPNAQ